MIGLRFELLAGRYHATPWDSHVNEGQVEWPPAPWRVLRALVAASYRLPTRNDAAVRALVLRLADSFPRYQLPPVNFAHTRAYLAQEKPGAGKLVFDAFAVAAGRTAAPDAVVVAWEDVVCGEGERALLAELAAQIGYLGRAESWVEAAVVDAPAEQGGQWVAEPCEDGDASVWCVTSDAEFAAWRAGFLAGGGKPKQAPVSRYDALVMGTSQLQKERWSNPPALRRVNYALRAPEARQLRARVSVREHAHLARFAIGAKVLPPVGRTLVMAERLRAALMSPKRHEGERVPQVFSGKLPDGTPLQGNQHAYFLPCDDDGDGMIDHLLVWSPVGFEEPGALRALQSIRSLWAEAGASEDDRYRLSLVGLGEATTFGRADGSGDRRSPAGTAALARSRVWVSETPFVPFRHAKKRGGNWVDTPEQQLALAVAHLPHLAAGGAVQAAVEADPSWSRTFLLERRGGGGSMGSRQGFRAELRFAEPVSGPVVLGYGAHFGLGLFRARAG